MEAERQAKQRRDEATKDGGVSVKEEKTFKKYLEDVCDEEAEGVSEGNVK